MGFQHHYGYEKQETVKICDDYKDLNKVCPKDNYRTPFIDQITDNYDGSIIFSFMNGFYRYN